MACCSMAAPPLPVLPLLPLLAPTTPAATPAPLLPLLLPPPLLLRAASLLLLLILLSLGLRFRLPRLPLLPYLPLPPRAVHATLCCRCFQGPLCFHPCAVDRTMCACIFLRWRTARLAAMMPCRVVGLIAGNARRLSPRPSCD